MQRLLVVIALVGCGNDYNRHTRAFVAPQACGQGPYDIHFKADGKTGGDGIEIIACTPRRISGHVMFAANNYELVNTTFGDVSDNARCMGGTPTVITTLGNEGNDTPARGNGGGAATAKAPTLIERPYRGSETPFADELCKDLGLTAQEVLGSTILTRHDTEHDFLPPGGDLHVRLWSDVPNDLDGVVFMIRHLTSTKTPAQQKKEDDKVKWNDGTVARKERPADHGPPPAPLSEEQPARPAATATWVPGYWSWTGATWGWVAGFWRDERYAPPAPRAEIPGEAPRPGAIWIGGTWSLRAGQYIWVTGRWR